ncbi:MAG: hypothetical protein V2J14_09710 [Erythrobacter sp.]|jgi:hypothetical protein|nr:hypothetical protein [Erythrobacter sp.]
MENPPGASSHNSPLVPSSLAWVFAALAGVVAPALAVLFVADDPVGARVAIVSGPILALGLMGTGMIAAANTGRFWLGILIALTCAAGLVLLAGAFDALDLGSAIPAGLAACIASVSFAARGTLFARSALGKGWWIAVFVVAGEAAILITAAALPGALPAWLLALLPAQWASIALQSAYATGNPLAAGPALVALAGTAAATMLVWWLWPRRWTYLIMFSTWLALSAMVYHNSAPPEPPDAQPQATGLAG